MFADEARFGRMNRSRRAGPAGHPAASGLPAHSRIHLFVRCGLSVGWDLRLFDYADLEHDLLPSFLNVLSRRFVRQEILLVLDGAPNHRCADLALPNNVSLLFLPPYAPELNPKENLWDEIREKIFKNYAIKSIGAVYLKLEEELFDDGRILDLQPHGPDVIGRDGGRERVASRWM
jgi:hypothetical protein